MDINTSSKKQTVNNANITEKIPRKQSHINSDNSFSVEMNKMGDKTISEQSSVVPQNNKATVSTISENKVAGTKVLHSTNIDLINNLVQTDIKEPKVIDNVKGVIATPEETLQNVVKEVAIQTSNRGVSKVPHEIDALVEQNTNVLPKVESNSKKTVNKQVKVDLATKEVVDTLPKQEPVLKNVQPNKTPKVETTTKEIVDTLPKQEPVLKNVQPNKTAKVETVAKEIVDTLPKIENTVEKVTDKLVQTKNSVVKPQTTESIKVEQPNKVKNEVKTATKEIVDTLPKQVVDTLPKQVVDTLPKQEPVLKNLQPNKTAKVEATIKVPQPSVTVDEVVKPNQEEVPQLQRTQQSQKTPKIQKTQKNKKDNTVSEKVIPTVQDLGIQTPKVETVVQTETKVTEKTEKVPNILNPLAQGNKKVIEQETKVTKTKTVTKTTPKNTVGQVEVAPVETEIEVVDNTTQTLLNVNKQLETITLKTAASKKLDYSSVKMDYDDAKFFADLVQNPEETLQTVVTELQNTTPEPTVQKAAKNVNVSASLVNLLSDAVKTNQPVRIDFDKDISIIIKVDKDGSLTAKFIPGDKAVEQYLKQNISALQQRFDDQEISYKELSYSNQQQRRNRRNNNKEN